MVLLQVESIELNALFPPADSDSTKSQSDEIALPGLFEGPSSAPGPSESIFDSVIGVIPTPEDEEQDLFGLECPERNMFRAPSNATSQCPLIKEYEGIWLWETPHPYSSLTCCLDTFKCPDSSDQIHIQIKSYFGIQTNSNPNQCEVKGSNHKKNYTDSKHLIVLHQI